jgi:ferredoxin--NADP+ reductase
VIGTNKKDAADTVAKILEDTEAGRLRTTVEMDDNELAAWIIQRAPDTITWQGWQTIDEHEQRLGKAQGRPRVKLVRLDALVSASRLTAVA